MNTSHVTKQIADAVNGGDDANLEMMFRAADLSCLRAVLYQLTGDGRLAAMKTGGGVQAAADRMAPPALEREEDREYVRKLALETLERLRNGSLAIPDPPTVAAFRPLAELFFAEALTDATLRFWHEEFGAVPLPRAARLDMPATVQVEDYNVIVIGGGMNGISSGVALKAAGISFTMLEQNPDIGGTWYRNRYPGARVDVASMAYCNTYEPFYPWKHNFALRTELMDYFHHNADKHGLWPHIRVNTRVTAMRWDNAGKFWNVDVQSPNGKDTLRARFVISAIGLFGRVSFPKIEGLDSFEGRLMHTAEWDESCEYAGKRVGVIGTGSSGIQLVSPIARKALRLTIFQRSPAWLSNMPGYEAPIPEAQRWLAESVPYYRNWLRLTSVFGIGDTYGKALDIDPDWNDPHSVNRTNHRLRETLLAYLRNKVGHRPDLMAKCIPDYPPLAKRLPKDNGWYDAVLMDHVDLVTTPIGSVTPRGVRTADGKEYEMDLLVLATGFKATEFLLAIDVQGDGVSLKEFWSKDGARAYWGMTIPHFPNLFCQYGPNTNGRAVGAAAWGEMQARYAVKCIANLMWSGKKAVDVKEERYDTYNRELDERLSRMIFSVPGQSSYFRNEYGRIATNGAFYNAEYFKATYEPDMNDFNVT
jgi:4-hydroxyacetophenone monooxygenase